jgi:hypothetical protein
MTNHLSFWKEPADRAEKRRHEVLIPFRDKPIREVAEWVLEYEMFWNKRLDDFEGYFRVKTKMRRKEQ